MSDFQRKINIMPQSLQHRTALEKKINIAFCFSLVFMFASWGVVGYLVYLIVQVLRRYLGGA